MTGASMELTGRDAVLAELAGYVSRARDAQGMFEQIGMSLVTSTQARFERGQAPSGSPWPPSLRALATGGKTLIESGRLLRSIVFQAFNTGVEVGTNVIYAAIHQLGGLINRPARQQTLTFKRGKDGKRLQGFRKKGRGNETQTVSIGAGVSHMPIRAFLGLDDDDNREILRIAEDWLAGEGAPA